MGRLKLNASSGSIFVSTPQRQATWGYQPGLQGARDLANATERRATGTGQEMKMPKRVSTTNDGARTSRW
jgi:hypothetical protein